MKHPKLIRLCPHCGSGDIRWCEISVRPYCAECHTWGRVNFGKALDAVREWNARHADAPSGTRESK